MNIYNVSEIDPDYDDENTDDKRVEICAVEFDWIFRGKLATNFIR